MKMTPKNRTHSAERLLSACAALSALVWMILIFAVGMTPPAYCATAAFVICSGAAALVRYHDTKDLPPEEKTPAPPLPFFRAEEAAARYCSHCGAPLRKHDQFCSKCGGKVQ